jgi:DNA-binding NtrC family response regulator
MALLVAYAWPGNIRELAAVIDRAVILGEGAGLEIVTALGVTPDIGTPSRGARSVTSFAPPIASMHAPLQAVMKQHIEAALAATHGRVEGPYGAARLLQINPHTLRGRMRKLGIKWSHFRSEPR